MLSLFRTNQPLYGFLLIFYIVLLWGSNFIYTHPFAPESAGVLAQELYDAVVPGSIGAFVISAGGMLLTAFVLIYLMIKYRIETETNLYIGIFYVLFCSSIPQFLHLSPLLLANVFLSFAVFCSFQFYKKPQSADWIFNVGFWIAVASLFYFCYAIFVFWGLFTLSVLRAFRIKECLMILCGFLTPYILLGTVYLWMDQYSFFWQNQVTANLGFLDFTPLSNSIDYWKIGLFTVLILFLLFNYNIYNYKKNIANQKKLTVMYGLLFFGLFSLLLQRNITLGHWQITAIPAAFFISMNFTRLSKRWAESAHFILLVLILAYQYRYLFIS